MESGVHRPSRGGLGTKVICGKPNFNLNATQSHTFEEFKELGTKEIQWKNYLPVSGLNICVLRKGLLNAINRTNTLSQHCGVPLALRPASAYRSYIHDIRHYSCRYGYASACRAAGCSSVHFWVVVELRTFWRGNLYWSQLTVLWLHCISNFNIHEEFEEGTPFV